MTQSKQKLMQVGLLAAFLLPMTVFAKQSPPENRIPIETARKTALSTYPGKVKSEELEFEGGKWIYSFDLSNASKTGIQEVQVDALTGKVIDSHAESSADEAKEKQNEAEEHKNK